MASLIDLNRKIAKLQKQADAIKNRERKGVIDRIRQAIDDYELTPADLFTESGAPVRRSRRAGGAGSDRVLADAGSNRPRRGRPLGAVSRNPVPIRYRDDKGNTWTGRGKTPNWLKAHIENGREANEFLIDQGEGDRPYA